jgi:hypothetical protein
LETHRRSVYGRRHGAVFVLEEKLWFIVKGHNHCYVVLSYVGTLCHVRTESARGRGQSLKVHGA